MASPNFLRGNSYAVQIKVQTAYGTPATMTSDFTTLFDACAFDNGLSAFEVKAKTLTNLPQAYEQIPGRHAPKLTLKGELTSAHGILFTALTGKASPDYELPSIATGPKCYTITRHYPDASKSDIAINCVLESLKIAQTSNAVASYEAVFRASALSYYQTATGITLGTIAAPFLPTGVFAVNRDSTAVASACESVEFNVAQTFADDEVEFMNSVTRNVAYVMGYTGSINVTAPMLTDKGLYTADLYGDATVPWHVNLRLANAVQIWDIASTGQLTESNSPDPDKGLFMFAPVFRLTGFEITASTP